MDFLAFNLIFKQVTSLHLEIEKQNIFNLGFFYHLNVIEGNWII